MLDSKIFILIAFALALVCVGDCRAQGNWQADAPALPFSPPVVAAASGAFQAIEDQQWTAARDIARRSGEPALISAVEHMVLNNNSDDQSISVFKEFLRNHPTWPQRERLIHKVEARLSKQKNNIAAADWYAWSSPRTATGKAHYAKILAEQGAHDKAFKLASEAWQSPFISLSDQTSLDRWFGNQWSAAVHWQRTDILLWYGLSRQARAMLPRLPQDQQVLARARIALRNKQGGVDAAIARVPPNLASDPGLRYERVRWRRIHDLDEGARELLNSLPKPLPEAKRWWPEIRLQIRKLIDVREWLQAYHLAKNHHQIANAPVSEAEWLAGWIALRFLDRPRDALVHFDSMYAVVRYPISLSRAAYWAGRAAARMNEMPTAQAWWRIAASYQTTFYGQLASEALGRETLTLRADPIVNAETQARLDDNPIARAAMLLGLGGRDKDMLAYVKHMTEQATTPETFGYIATLGRRANLPHIAIAGAKSAGPKGIILTGPAFPVPFGDTTRQHLETGPELALALALARQESEMNPHAVSRAGARGLMQLMPATAKQVSRQLGKPYRRSRLTNDPDYNLLLGGHYLQSVLERYDGNPVLALAAYNAGPSRADRWIVKNGDPRDPRIDAVDWIELVPFAETRNYIQRVMESLQVYRHLLNSQEARLALEAELKKSSLTGRSAGENRS